MKKRLTYIWTFLRELYEEWQADGCFQLAAALSYYTVFSIAPMCVVVIAVASSFLERKAVTGELYTQMQALIGPDAAASIQALVANVQQEDQGLLATVIGSGMLLFSATAAFTALQQALNKIYKVKADVKTDIGTVIIHRLFSFVMVLVMGGLVVVSLLLDVMLRVLDEYVQQLLTDYAVYLLRVLHTGLSFGIITVLFALLFKFLPDVSIRWRYIWQGALLTAVLFILGKSLIGFYLAHSNVTSTFGAAASIILVMLWVNYSACILFIGAQYIDVCLKLKGEEIEPAHFARKIRLPRRANLRVKSDQ